MKKSIRVILAISLCTLLMGSQCVPEDFWFNKWSSYLSNGVDAIVDQIVTAATNPAD